jgi:hypothetical protein
MPAARASLAAVLGVQFMAVNALWPKLPRDSESRLSLGVLS